MIEGRLVPSKGQLQVVTMLEKQTPLLMGSLVSDGQTQSRMIMISPMWEITTSVGIQTGLPNPRCGATPLILSIENRIAQFHPAPP